MLMTKEEDDFSRPDYTCWLPENRGKARLVQGLSVLFVRCSVVVASSPGLIYASWSQAGDPQENWRKMLLYKGEQGTGWRKIQHQYETKLGPFSRIRALVMTEDQSALLCGP